MTVTISLPASTLKLNYRVTCCRHPRSCLTPTHSHVLLAPPLMSHSHSTCHHPLMSPSHSHSQSRQTHIHTRPSRRPLLRHLRRTPPAQASPSSAHYQITPYHSRSFYVQLPNVSCSLRWRAIACSAGPRVATLLKVPLSSSSVAGALPCRACCSVEGAIRSS